MKKNYLLIPILFLPLISLVSCGANKNNEQVKSSAEQKILDKEEIIEKTLEKLLTDKEETKKYLQAIDAKEQEIQSTEEETKKYLQAIDAKQKEIKSKMETLVQKEQVATKKLEHIESKQEEMSKTFETKEKEQDEKLGALLQKETEVSKYLATLSKTIDQLSDDELFELKTIMYEELIAEKEEKNILFYPNSKADKSKFVIGYYPMSTDFAYSLENFRGSWKIKVDFIRATPLAEWTETKKLYSKMTYRIYGYWGVKHFDVSKNIFFT